MTMQVEAVKPAKRPIGEDKPAGAASLKIWIDGKLRDKADATVSVYDHGLLYGDGIFEGVRAYNGKIFDNPSHLRRLFDSAKSIRLTIPFSADEIDRAMIDTMRANGFSDCYFRVVITRGAGDLGVDPRKAKTPCVIIIADKVGIYPKDAYDKGIAVITSSVVRNHANSCNPRIKSLNYLNNVLAKIEANDAGVADALMLNHEGNIAEMTAANVFLLRDGVLSTPTTSCGILEGVTRATVMKLCAKLCIPVVEKRLQRHDVYIAEEMFVTGTGAEVMPITKVDGRVIGSGVAGPVTKRVMEAYHRHVRE